MKKKNNLTVVKENNLVLDEKPKDITLNSRLRKLLIEIVSKIIVCPDEKKEFDTLSAKLKQKITEFVRIKFPEEDMQILEKYGKVDLYQNVRLYYSNDCGSVLDVYIEIESTKLPKDFNNYSSFSIRESKILNDSLKNLFFETKKSKEDLDKAIKNKKYSYENLINNSKKLSQVQSVWEDVLDYLLPHIEQEYPSNVTEDQLNLIKKDVELRKSNKLEKAS